MLDGSLGLRNSREVYQNTQVQPMKGSVPMPETKARNVTLWSKARASIHATRAILSAPVWGSTKPTDFMTIQGVMPQAPVIISVPEIAGSNTPLGGSKV